MTEMQFAAVQKSCCFTGHRMIERAVQPRLQQLLTETLRRLIEETDTVNFIAGGALGFDTLAAETVLSLKKDYPHIRLLLALPCPEQAVRWKPSEIDRYEKILNECDRFAYVCEHYTPSCMHERNRFMVDHSSLCIAYLKDTRGGTAYTVGYAKKRGIACINLADYIR